MGACKKSESNPFAGTWTGTFTGNDSGTWTVYINDKGTVSGGGTSVVANGPFIISGKINNTGNMVATFGTSSLDGTFNGTMSGTQATGTWFNGNYLGTWTGTKQ